MHTASLTDKAVCIFGRRKQSLWQIKQSVKSLKSRDAFEENTRLILRILQLCITFVWSTYKK
ncbi:hypothetical protein B5F91_07345 [Bacteroides sp. An322]|nr:hypothetical protein B5F91_07345 [Bacteroides sp. An322]